eukprot:56267-Alexandrium_andersonii.AAC.1
MNRAVTQGAPHLRPPETTISLLRKANCHRETNSPDALEARRRFATARLRPITERMGGRRQSRLTS